MQLASKRVSVAAAGLPGRYAFALFDLAEEARALDGVAADLDRLAQALDGSREFAALVAARGLSRADTGAALERVSDQLGLCDLVRRFLGVMAANGRLALLPAVVRQYRAMLAAHRGTGTAHVTAAHPLSPAQHQALSDKLRQRTGQAMDLDVTVDPAILGGLVVRIGSEQIDTSIRTRLERLGQLMKG